MTDPRDLEWGLERAHAGDSRGFHALFRILGPGVVGYLRARKVDDPDGIANDVFLRAFRKLDTFDGDAGHFRSWLFTIAHNAAIDNARARQRWPPVTAIEKLPEPSTTADPVAETAEAHVGNERVEALLALLSPDQRDVILLRIVADLSVLETAAIVGKGEEAVKALQRRALAALRRQIFFTRGRTTMNDDDVHPDEMSGTHEFDDEAIEALLSGTGAEINEDLAAAVGSLRAAYVSQPPAVGQELSSMIGDGWAAAPTSRSPRRMRLPVALRRLAVATAALFALTGALGVANTLPGPMQDAVAKVGIGSGHNDNHGKTVSEVAKDKSLQGCEHGRAVSAAASGKTNTKPCPNSSATSTASTTTVPGGEGGAAGAAPSVAGDDNHGRSVSDVAKDKALQGCEHGRAVSAAASGKTNTKPCPTTSTTTTSTPTTVPGAGGAIADDDEAAPTTAPGNSGAHGQDGTKPSDDGTNNGNGRPTGRVNQANGSPDDD